MTTTVINVFADSSSTSYSANGPDLTPSYPSSSTSTNTQTHSSHLGFDADGPTNTYNSAKYVYQITYSYTDVSIELQQSSVDWVPGTTNTQSTTGEGTFYYRGSSTQAGATDTLPASSSTTQYADTTAGDAIYNVFRTFNKSATWHWEGNLFNIDGVGSDSLPTFAVESTLTCDSRVNPGGELIVASDSQVNCTGTKIHSGEVVAQSQFATAITTAVVHDFDISSVVLTYVESYDPYASSDYTDTNYFDDGKYTPDGYVETQSLTGIIQEVDSDGQLTATGGFLLTGDTSIASDCQVIVSGIARPSLQGEAVIASDAQTSITAVNIFGTTGSTMATDTATTCLAGNLIEVGGANYYNRYAEDDYITPEADLNDFASDAQVTASAIRLQGGEGLLESAAAIQLEGGYLVSQGSLLLNGDGQLSIDQSAGTSAGLILSTAELDATIDAQLTPSASNTIAMQAETFAINSQISIIGGEIDFGVMSIVIDAQLIMEGTIVPGAQSKMFADSQLTAVGGFLKDLEAAIQSDGFQLTIAQYKIVDPFRTIKVKSETRTIIVPIEDRLVLLDAETRVNKVGQEIRTYLVPQETRQIQAQYLQLDRGSPVGSNERRIG